MDHLQASGIYQCSFCGESLAGNPQFSPCEKPPCRLKRQQQSLRKRQERRRAQVHALAQKEILCQQRHAEKHDKLASDVAMLEVPHYHPGPELVTEDRIAPFEAHLRRMLASIDDVESEEKFRSPQGVPQSHRLDAVLTKACASCNGWCCRQGKKTHAFIQRSTLLRVIDELNECDEDRLVEVYKSYIPDIANKHSCVYHTEQGCCLPGQLRADICDEFFCPSLDKYIDEHRDNRQPKETMIFSVADYTIKAVNIVSPSGNMEPVSEPS